jgi:hypothetical protein
LHSKAFFVLSMHWLIHVLAIHSAINAVPILGCMRRLLLSLFIKLDSTHKCGVVWFIIKKLNQSFLFWILLRIVLWLDVYLLPIHIKRFSSVHLVLDCKSVMNLPPIETYPSSICYHLPFWKRRII